MLKMCGKLFTSYLQFVVRRHKINGKHPVKNYRPISTPRLLHIFLLNFVIQNYRISSAQSDFKPIDSCINQLLSIINETNHSTDEGYEVRGVLLDISKAFKKVWQEGLVFKLNQNGISGSLLKILENFLRNRKQRLVLNGQTSNWKNNHAGVPPGSILRPMFLNYINNLAENL